MCGHSWKGGIHLVHTVSQFQPGISSVGQEVDLAKPQLDNPADLAVHLGLRSTRTANQLLRRWKHELLFNDGLLWWLCSQTPMIRYLSSDWFQTLRTVDDSLVEVSGQPLMVKTLNCKKLNGHSDDLSGDESWLQISLETLVWTSSDKHTCCPTVEDPEWPVHPGTPWQHHTFPP